MHTHKVTKRDKLNLLTCWMYWNLLTELLNADRRRSNCIFSGCCVQNSKTKKQNRLSKVKLELFLAIKTSAITKKKV